MKLKLYDRFKHWQDDGAIWVFSDPHFGDDHLEEYPNWLSSDEIVKNINSKVGKNDTLIILGDVGDINPIKKLKGYKILITGNHDKGASNYLVDKREEGYYCEDYVDFDSMNKEKSEARDKGVEYFNKHLNEIENKYYKEGEKKLIKQLRKDKDFVRLSNLVISRIMDSWVAYFSNRMFDEVYDGPLFISDKILLSHEPIKLGFGYNIHGHVHQGEQFKYWTNESVQINVCSDVRNFEPIRLDKLIEEFKVSTLHRLTIDKATENSKKEKK